MEFMKSVMDEQIVKNREGKVVEARERPNLEKTDKPTVEQPDIVFIERTSREALIEQCLSNPSESKAGEEAQLESNETSRVDVEKPDHLPTIREDLDGKKHPETGVPYEKQTVETPDGKKVEGVFPKFDSVFDTEIPPEQYKDSDASQFNTCNQKLKEAVEKDPTLRSKFNEKQLEQINNGDRPTGYTWHHNEKVGRMQLVPTDIHSKTPHTGGRSIWGGGKDYR